MTEAEWLGCDDPEPMLEYLRGRASERKLRLFACACVRRAWPLLSDTGRHAVETAEAYADGMIDTGALAAAAGAAHKPVDDAIEAANSSYIGPGFDPPLSAADAASAASSGMGSDITGHLVPLRAAHAARDALGGRTGGECVAQAVLLRDVLGNPFHPSPALSAAVLLWNDSTITRIAQGIYDERHLPAGTLDAGRLAILADALLDAGCDDEELLAHLRSEGPHVRGCWAVDRILGKG